MSVLTAEKQLSVQARQRRQLANASLVSGPISVRSSTHVAEEGDLAPRHVGLAPGGSEDGAGGLAEAALAAGDHMVVKGQELLRRRFLGGAPCGDRALIRYPPQNGRG